MVDVFLGQGDVGRGVRVLFWCLYDFDWEDDRVDDFVVLWWGDGIDVVVCGVYEVDDVFVYYLVVYFYFEYEFVVVVINQSEVYF